jgi:glycosidase
VPDPQTPDWVRDAVFYQIFPDRFARSLTVPKPNRLDPWGATPTWYGYQGGDLIGVVERLDYLCDLGVNALYFTPIFQSASNHRYHTHDYEKVDPMLGGNDALRRLLDAAHARGLRVVLDGVFNHASRGFFQFHDILENGRNSAYLDWFTVKDLELPLYAYDADGRPTTWPGGTCRPCRSSTSGPRRSASSCWASPAAGSTSASTAGGSTWPTRSTTTTSGASSAAASAPATPRPTSSARSGSTPATGSRATCGTR